MTPVGEWGTIRLRTRYLHDLIMPEEEYSPLKGSSFYLKINANWKKKFFLIHRIIAGSSFGGCSCISRLVPFGPRSIGDVFAASFQVRLLFISLKCNPYCLFFWSIDMNVKKLIYYRLSMMLKLTRKKKHLRCLELPPWQQHWWIITWNRFVLHFWRLPLAKQFINWWKLNNPVK